jgi:hypothetical protein
VQPVHAAVLSVARASHEAGGLEPLHDPRHRRGPHLFGCSELAERARPAEDEHRERRQLRRRDAGGRVFTANMPKRVNCRRVEAVGCFD